MTALTANQRIYAAAQRYLGVCEVPGPKSNALIQSWIKQADALLDHGLDTDDSQTSWCGIFRGVIGMETATGIPAAHDRARNWLAWGRVIDHTKPQLWLQGDTIIMQRPGGQHVTLFSDIANKAFANCLGGNQADKVCIAPMNLSRIIGVRRAPDL